MNSSLGSACLPCGGCHGTRSGGVGPYLPTMLRPIVRGGAQLHRPLHAAAFHTSLSHNSVTVLSTKKSEQTYHPRGYENSMGYRRARKPYLVRNTIGFLLISGFIVGVYAYSIMMVEQDDFSDLENFRVLPAEEMAPSPANKSTSLPSTDSSTVKMQENSITQSGPSVWQWLSSFVKPVVTTATAETATRDPTSGPVMNKKAI